MFLNYSLTPFRLEANRIKFLLTQYLGVQVFEKLVLMKTRSFRDEVSDLCVIHRRMLLRSRKDKKLSKEFILNNNETILLPTHEEWQKILQYCNMFFSLNQKHVLEDIKNNLIEDSLPVRYYRNTVGKAMPKVINATLYSGINTPKTETSAAVTRKIPEKKNYTDPSRNGLSTVIFRGFKVIPPMTTKPAPGGLKVIFPGTKWCGSGDIATRDDDLGILADVDKCCREHDKCDDYIEGGQSKYNLTNYSPFTVLDCKCDDEFYSCLSRIGSITANTIGNTFFNFLGRHCFFLDYPKKCKRYRTFLKLGCEKFEIDKAAKKIYQWRSARTYEQTFSRSLTFF
ncbi:phospholipase A2 [Caerostris darwini]|uniref:Phospholipase A2 n=1 Tax=Caerostris darwini TaxID=1538125 RepID=A0AAV4WBH9_9ARAC|nr:phospholipase A2 [Caerostris darwini]